MCTETDDLVLEINNVEPVSGVILRELSHSTSQIIIDSKLARFVY